MICHHLPRVSCHPRCKFRALEQISCNSAFFLPKSRNTAIKVQGIKYQTKRYHIMYISKEQCGRNDVFNDASIYLDDGSQLYIGFSNYGSNILQILNPDLKLNSLQGPPTKPPAAASSPINFQRGPARPPSSSGNLQPRKHRHLYLVRSCVFRSHWLVGYFEATKNKHVVFIEDHRPIKLNSMLY